jgi:hypothetical protein
MVKRRPPGTIRDAIIRALEARPHKEGSPSQVSAEVNALLGEQIPRSSVRSQLRINQVRFVRVEHGRYRLRGRR